MDKKVEYEHEIQKVQPLKDGGFRITIDIPVIHATQATWLMLQSQRTGVYFRTVTEAIEANREDNNKKQQNDRVEA